MHLAKNPSFLAKQTSLNAKQGGTSSTLEYRTWFYKPISHGRDSHSQECECARIPVTIDFWIIVNRPAVKKEDDPSSSLLIPRFTESQDPNTTEPSDVYRATYSHKGVFFLQAEANCVIASAGTTDEAPPRQGWHLSPWGPQKYHLQPLLSTFRKPANYSELSKTQNEWAKLHFWCKRALW